VPPPQPCSTTHYRHEVTGRRIPHTSSNIPSLTYNTAHAESAQISCTQLQQTSHPSILYPEATDTANIIQQNDGPPSKRTRSKCPLNVSTQSQSFRHTHHSGAHLTQQLPLTAHLATQPAHIDTLSMHKKAQQNDGPPSKRTRSQCPDHKALHQTPVVPTMHYLPLSAPADHPTLSCNLQPNPPQQKSQCSGIHTRTLARSHDHQAYSSTRAHARIHTRTLARSHDHQANSSTHAHARIHTRTLARSHDHQAYSSTRVHAGIHTRTLARSHDHQA